MFTSRFASLSVMSLVAAAGAQPIGPPAAKGPGAAPDLLPADSIIAALPYDGVGRWGARGQDYETAFDCYDTFIIEDFEIFEDARVAAFSSRGFGNGGNPSGLEDFVGEIWTDQGDGPPGSDTYSGEFVMRSVVGAGDFTGDGMMTTFGGQCLPAGRYYLLFSVRLDFGCCGSYNFFTQRGEPSVGGGRADNAWQWNPGGCFGLGRDPFRVTDDQDQLSGVNYIVSGVPADCDCLADLNVDGVLDINDFFQYLDLFAAGDQLADLTGDEPGIPDGIVDVADFFFYLDLFAAGCD